MTCDLSRKTEILEGAQNEVQETEAQYNDGLIMGEKYNKVVDIWSKVTDEVSKELIREISTEEVSDQMARWSSKVHSTTST